MKIHLKVLAAMFVLLSGMSTYAQTDVQKQLEQAERNFAARSKQTSTKQAFTEVLDKEGMIKRNGIVNGLEFWQNNPDEGELLFWQPSFVDVSAAGDYGFTTGPYYIQRDRNGGSKMNGHYLSVWKKTADDWKLFIDFGVGHPAESTDTLITYAPSLKNNILNISSSDPEQTFLNSFSTKGFPALSDAISAQTRILRPRELPFVGEAAKQYAASENKTFVYQNQKTVFSAAKDMAFSWGTCDVTLPAPMNRKLKTAYLRIWKFEGNKWVLAADIISL